jgi:prepilin-type N-terminal cleavage/methylation domain-containing protein
MLKKRGQKGFTLIEIIAVLVILGILAAVAIPKYMGMQDDAKNAAGLGALGAAAGNVQAVYAKLLLSATTPTIANLITSINVAAFQTVGDFTVTYAAGTVPSSDVLITLTGPAGKYGTPSSKNVPVLQ